MCLGKKLFSSLVVPVFMNWYRLREGKSSNKEVAGQRKAFDGVWTCLYEWVNVWL